MTIDSASDATAIPDESLPRLFLRFLHFGALAWGGPVAQIAMLRQALVDEERWVTSAHFNRVLALYQALPGPEAHELCVYFGMLARGRAGGIVAGLAFMLPGFVLMFALSWAYTSLGLDVRGEFALVFAAIQAAVAALIVRAVQRIGSHALADRWTWAIAILCALGHLAGLHFGLLLLSGGIVYVLAQRWPIAALAAVFVAGIATLVWYAARPGGALVESSNMHAALGTASLAALFWAGLKAGALTFGGAYTAIPLLQHDAVTRGGWMSNAQFMDGIALGGLLPAPLIIFSTFVGYVGGGPMGALIMTFATFLPAFAMTLLAHEPMERLIRDARVRTFLDGLTAAVVGLIAATALSLMMANIRSPAGMLVFAAALLTLFVWSSRLAIPCVIAAAALAGVATMMWSG